MTSGPDGSDARPPAPSPRPRSLPGSEHRLVAALVDLGPALDPTPAARARMRTTLLADGPAGTTAVEDALVTLGPALDPSPAARTRMRTTVLAGTTTEPATTPRGTGDLAAAARRREARGTHGVRGRLLVASAAALCLVFALSAVSLVLSRDAMPGDALYALKRTGENAQLELTFGESDRALRELDFAARRVDELVALVATGGADTVRTDELLGAFDDGTSAGSTLLTSLGVAGDPAAFTSITTWAQGQDVRLATELAGLPTGGAERVAASRDLLAAVTVRAAELAARVGCSPITSGSTDALGPLPAAAPCDGTTAQTVTTSAAPGGIPPEVAVPATTTTSPAVTAAPGGPTGSATTTAPGAAGPVATTPSRPPATAAAPTVTTPAPLPTAPGAPPVLTIPLPIPPVTIPPLLPGLPGISLGG